jgi:hypothetical protein
MYNHSHSRFLMGPIVPVKKALRAKKFIWCFMRHNTFPREEGGMGYAIRRFRQERTGQKLSRHLFAADSADLNIDTLMVHLDVFSAKIVKQDSSWMAV